MADDFGHVCYFDLNSGVPQDISDQISRGELTTTWKTVTTCFDIGGYIPFRNEYSIYCAVFNNRYDLIQFILKNAPLVSVNFGYLFRHRLECVSEEFMNGVNKSLLNTASEIGISNEDLEFYGFSWNHS